MNFTLQKADGSEVQYDHYAGKVLLVVNVASQCGFTKQYEGLQKLHQKFHDRGFEVLAFPCNQFGGQEPGTDQEIQTFCSTRYHVTFPVFKKIEVNGAHAHPFFQYLKQEAKGLLGTEAIKWNFTKFLIGRQGQVIERFASMEDPENLEHRIEMALDENN